MTDEVVTSYADVASVRKNVIHLNETPESSFESSKVTFHGTGNVLHVEDGATLRGCNLRFRGNDAVIYIRASTRPIKVSATLYNVSVVYIGSGASFTTAARIVPSERTHVIIGSDTMFSSRVSFRTGDPHLIYSAITHERVNPSRSIWVGDHVWLGEETLVLKGARIGSGAILAARSVVTKDVPSNVTAAGSPAKVVGSEIFWTRPSVHAYTRQQTLKSQVHRGDHFVYRPGRGVIDPDVLEAELEKATCSAERAEWCRRLDGMEAVDRFYREYTEDLTERTAPRPLRRPRPRRRRWLGRLRRR